MLHRADILSSYWLFSLTLSFQESSSEDDLDDEAMIKLDDALAAVFKSQLQAKSNKNNKKGEVLYSCVVKLHRK